MGQCERTPVLNCILQVNSLYLCKTFWPMQIGLAGFGEGEGARSW